MDAIVKPWLDLWDCLDRNFWHVWQWARDSLDADRVAWQPAPEVASIGWNLQHLGEMLDYYLCRVFNRGDQVWPGALVTMRSGSQDDGRFRDLQAIGKYHRQVRAPYRGFLAELSGADLDRVIERQGRQAFTYAWAIGHIAEHESYHLGKCTLLRNLLPR